VASPNPAKPSEIRDRIILIALFGSLTVLILLSPLISRHVNGQVSESTLSGPHAPLATYPLGIFYERTADTNDNHMMLVGIALAYSRTNTTLRSELLKKQESIRSSISNLLGLQKMEFLRNSESKDILKLDIDTSVNSQLTNPGIEDVYFTQFVVN